MQAMFDRIAGVYDLLNIVMTAGLHHRWRERAADLARVGPGSHVLDVATGTGDLAIELARRVAPGGEVVGSDFSEAMLARARAKPKPAGAELRFQYGDALELTGLPAVEVHLSDVDAREAWRRQSVIAELCIASVAGQGIEGYREALVRLSKELDG